MIISAFRDHSRSLSQTINNQRLRLETKPLALHRLAMEPQERLKLLVRQVLLLLHLVLELEELPTMSKRCLHLQRSSCMCCNLLLQLELMLRNHSLELLRKLEQLRILVLVRSIQVQELHNRTYVRAIA